MKIQHAASIHVIRIGAAQPQTAQALPPEAPHPVAPPEPPVFRPPAPYTQTDEQVARRVRETREARA
jgi:hypothetical protein